MGIVTAILRHNAVPIESLPDITLSNLSAYSPLNLHPNPAKLVLKFPLCQIPASVVLAVLIIGEILLKLPQVSKGNSPAL